MYTELDPRHDMQPHLPRILTRDVYYPGQTIIEQGSAAHRAFYIEKGRVEVTVREDAYTMRVAELGPGEIFGEMALLGNHERTAAVRALETTTVTVISEHDLEEKLCYGGEKVAVMLMRVFMDRLRRANRSRLEQYRSLSEFQDRIAGIVEKARHGINEDRRNEFRAEAGPLLDRLEDLLEKYRA